MRILLAGGHGQLGKAIVSTVAVSARTETHLIVSSPIELHVLPRACDVRNFKDVLLEAESFQPDWIVNAAAFTQVDKAQIDPHQAISTNALGAANLAIVASQTGARLLYFSTESVFDGADSNPYTEESVKNPLSVYSISKSAGEDLSRSLCDKTYIVRTSWLYGESSTANFPARLANQLTSSKAVVPVVTDLVGNPTPTSVLAEAVLSMMLNPPDFGVYHICAQGSCTKYEWALEISKFLGFPSTRISKTTSDQFPSPAKRSKHVDLACAKFLSTGILDLPNWADFYRHR